MADTAKDGMDWRHKDLVCGAMGELFTGDAILLFGESEKNAVRGRDKIEVTGSSIEAVVARKKVHILEAERRSVVVIGGMYMFARTEEEKETYNTTIARCTKHWVRQGIGRLNGCRDKWHWDGLDSFRWRVLMGVAFQLIFEAEFGLAVGHVTGVKGPQAGDLLANGTHIVLH
jgi:hypothetical protein